MVGSDPYQHLSEAQVTGNKSEVVFVLDIKLGLRMKTILIIFVFASLFIPMKLVAQEPLPSEPSPKEYIVCWPEPTPLNLDSLKSHIRHPGICAEGKVIVRVLLDTDGHYLKHNVLKTPHELWTNAVAAVLPMLRCTPAFIAGKPVKCWITIPFSIR